MQKARQDGGRGRARPVGLGFANCPNVLGQSRRDRAVVVLVVHAALLPFIVMYTGCDDQSIVAPTQAIVCDEPDVDKGALTPVEAASVSHRFLLRNQSDTPIRITGHRTTCECTAPDYSKDAIAPGGTAPVTVAVNWAGRAGAQNATVLIHTDHAAAKTIQLHVRGFARVSAVVSPPYINFGTVMMGEQVARLIKVTSATDPRPFRIVSVSGADAPLSLRRMSNGVAGAEALDGPPGDFELRIQAPTTQPGPWSARLVFRTDLADLPELPLDVRAEFAGALRATPKSLLFKGGQGVETRQVEVERDPGLPPVTAEVVGDDAGLRAFTSVKTLEDNHGGRSNIVLVTVTFVQKEVSGAFVRARLRVTSGGQAVEVPLMGLAADREATSSKPTEMPCP